MVNTVQKDKTMKMYHLLNFYVRKFNYYWLFIFILSFFQIIISSFLIKIKVLYLFYNPRFLEIFNNNNGCFYMLYYIIILNKAFFYFDDNLVIIMLYVVDEGWSDL